MISELCYAGKPLSEIAGYSTLQMTHMLFLKRNKWGQLVDPEDTLPDGIEVDDNGMRVISQNNRMPFTQAYRRAKKAQGLDDTQAQKAWDQYLNDNPTLDKLIKRREMATSRRMKSGPAGA